MFDRFDIIKDHGHRYHRIHDPFSAKEGSHDDGPATGLFLGGIGTPCCSRDLTGRFSRWHLETGTHVHQEIAEAFLAVKWTSGSLNGYFRLDESCTEQQIQRDVYSLFPVTQERYGGDGIPFTLIVEFFSPIIPKDNQASTLPVWYVTISVENISDDDLSVDIALFWLNFLGWQNQRMTPVDRPQKSWPSQTHAGNTARSYSSDSGLSGVIQQRFPQRPALNSMDGEVAVLAKGNRSQRQSAEVCYKAGQNCIDRLPEDQKFTITWVEHYFSEHGCLPESPERWTAHWDEAIGSAVAVGTTLNLGEKDDLSFCVAFDLPRVTFGSGRVWYRKYTDTFGISGRTSSIIAEFAMENLARYRTEIGIWHHSILSDQEILDTKLKAAMINELYLLNGGGSVWVSCCEDQTDIGISTPALGSGEHAGILEGFDIGYYYYNTSDLWPYAWYAISRWWPDFSELVFSDYLKTIPMEDKREHIIYRTEQMSPMMTAGKLPHDIGSVMADPWHELNGYQMRDDSNLWKDHNPGFIVSCYLHKRLLGKELNTSAWESIRLACEFLLSQVGDDGLPFHDEFGDSTWDNLGVRGRAAYSGSLTIACYAVMIRWAEEMGDQKLAQSCRDRLLVSQRAFRENLWNGSYFKLCDTGTYADCIMPDGIFGFFLADIAGMADDITAITADEMRSHLQAVYTYSFRNYFEGAYGPLLVAEPDRTEFPGDGGDELQVNEILVGSAWLTVSMMRHYGMNREADEIAQALMQTLYEDSGLQFRTPAAFCGRRRFFRAPMNMRPLSIWFLDAARLQHT